MHDRVAATINRYIMLSAGQGVGVAVSGGADSVALLYVLFELAPRWALRLKVLHLNHLLRGEESAEDARFVAELAAGLGLECVFREADVARQASVTGDNLEQAGRRARHAFFTELLRDGAVDRVALGHTRSDQAETVLFRLLRGSGTAGLAGIHPVTREGLIRPLLDITRPEIEQYLRDRGIAWREDASNSDIRFDRNRIRHVLLPQLTREWNPMLPEVLARMAVVARDEELYWSGETERLASELLVWDRGALVGEVNRLRALHPAVLRRLVRRAIAAVKRDLRGIDAAHVERVLELIQAGDGDGRAQLPGVEAARSVGWVRFAAAGRGREAPPYQMAVQAPGRYRIPGESSVICLQLKDTTEGTDQIGGYNTKGGTGLDGKQVPAVLVLRNWRPGDRFRPSGKPHAEKLKTLFQQARIPIWDRDRWPVICGGDTIIWTRAFGVAEGYAARRGRRRVLDIQEFPPVSRRGVEDFSANG